MAPEFATQHDDIPWLVMYTMRNRVSHGYDKVDLEIIWKTIHSDLPVLHVQVTEALTSFQATSTMKGWDHEEGAHRR